MSGCGCNQTSYGAHPAALVGAASALKAAHAARAAHLAARPVTMAALNRATALQTATNFVPLLVLSQSPMEQAKASGRNAAQVYGAMARRSPAGREKYAKLQEGIVRRDPRADAAARKMREAALAMNLANAVQRGDEQAVQAHEALLFFADSDPFAAEALAMIDEYLTPTTALGQEEADVLSTQWDSVPDLNMYDFFTPEELAVGFIKSQEDEGF